MSTAILRPHGTLGATEAMSLRDSFDHVLQTGGDGVIVDLTGVQELSASGLAAVTNIVVRGRRIGIPVRVLLPEEGSRAAGVVDQADLRRFLAPGGLWDTRTAPSAQTGTSNGCGVAKRAGRQRFWFAVQRRGALGTTGRGTAAAACDCKRPDWMNPSQTCESSLRSDPAREPLAAVS